MKLDLLYEIDVPRPWGTKGHPYDQRAAEQKSYAEAMDQVAFADTLGFITPSGWSSTTSVRAAATVRHPRSSSGRCRSALSRSRWASA